MSVLNDPPNPAPEFERTGALVRDAMEHSPGIGVSRRGLIAAGSMAAIGATAASRGAQAQAQVPARWPEAPAYTGPIKRIQLAHPRPGISAQEFDDHWRHPHATLVRDMRGVRKYIQHHRLASEAFKDSDSTYLAIAEVWQDSIAAGDQSQDPHFINYVQPDEPNFVDQSKHIITTTREDIVQANRGMVAPDAPFGDLYWSDKDANIYVTLTQFVRDRSVDWTRDESLELSRRLGAFRQVINRSVEPDSEMAVIRQFLWPHLTLFERAVAADREAFDDLRRTPRSFLYLAQSERVF